MIYELYWQKSIRDGKPWVDLVCGSTEDESWQDLVLNHSLLDREQWKIRPADIVTAVQAHLPGMQVDGKQLLEDLHDEVFHNSVAARYIAFHASMEGDPGMGAVHKMFILARSPLQAQRKYYKKRSGEFDLVVIWPLDALILTLQGAAALSVEEFEKLIDTR